MSTLGPNSKYPSAAKYRAALLAIHRKLTLNQLLLLQRHYRARPVP
jgi:hypothetical protein